MKKIHVGLFLASATAFGMGAGDYSNGDFGNHQKRSRSFSEISESSEEASPVRRLRVSDSEKTVSSSDSEEDSSPWMSDGVAAFLQKLALKREDGDEILSFPENGKSFLEFVRYLIEDRKIDINEANDDGSTLLHLASEDEHLGVVEYLIEHSADVNKGNNDGQTPLVFACQSNNETVIRYLVEHGADVNKENNQGEIPLMCSCELGNEAVVKYLIEKGANANKEDKNGEIPLFSACRSGNESLVKYLAEKIGADINKTDEEGNTPLMCACELGHETVVKCLVEHGADVNAENEEGLTPLFNAREIAGSDDIAEYLLINGAEDASLNIPEGIGFNLAEYPTQNATVDEGESSETVSASEDSNYSE